MESDRPDLRVVEAELDEAVNAVLIRVPVAVARLGPETPENKAQLRHLKRLKALALFLRVGDDVLMRNLPPEDVYAVQGEIWERFLAYLQVARLRGWLDL